MGMKKSSIHTDLKNVNLILVKSAPKKAVLWIRINFFRIRIQSLMLQTNTDPDPDPIRIQGFNDEKLKKNYS
jgi:hypothetical protein